MKVFLSSTYDDLKEHRRHVIEAVEQAGLSIDPMEKWGADPREPTEFSQDRVLGCDLFILLIGRRRGYVPKGHTTSITQQEYQVAVDNHIPVFAYMLKEGAPWYAEFDDTKTDPEVSKWRERISTEHGTGFFGLEPNSIDVSSDLSRWIHERSANNDRVGTYILELTRTKEFSDQTHYRLLSQVIIRLNQMMQTGTVEEDVLAILDPFLKKDTPISKLEKEWVSLNTLAEDPPYSAIRVLLKRGKIVFFLGTNATFLLSRSPKDHQHIISELAKVVNYRNFEGSLSEISEFYEMNRMEYGRSLLLDNLSKLYEGVNKELAIPSFYKALAKLAKEEKPLVLISAAQDNLLEQALDDNSAKFVSVSPVTAAQSRNIGSLRIIYSDQPGVISCTREELSSQDPLGKDYSLIYRTCGPSLKRNLEEQLDILPITENDYVTAARYLDRLMPDYLIEALRKRVILFLGYAPQHWEDRLLVRHILKDRLGKQPSDVAITKSGDQFERAFWQHYEVDRYEVALEEFAHSLLE